VRQENRFIDGSGGRKSGTGELLLIMGCGSFDVWIFCHRSFAIAGNRAGGGWVKLASKRLFAR